MSRSTLPAAILISCVFCAACARTPELETRTFAVSNLQPHEVDAIVAPYVFTDREGRPGTFSATSGAVTVRETADNLDKIARVLDQFDRARPDVRLRFQVIEADGFTDSDARIADVEQELRKLFQFEGYRLTAEAVVTVTDGGEIQQTLSGRDGPYIVTGRVVRRSSAAAQLDELRFWRGFVGSEVLLQTSVAIRDGQTLVLGSSPRAGSTATLLLTVHAEPAGG